MLNRLLNYIGIKDQEPPKSLSAKRKFKARRGMAQRTHRPTKKAINETLSIHEAKNTSTSSSDSTSSTLRNLVIATLPVLASGASCSDSPFNRVDFSIGENEYSIMTKSGEMPSSMCYFLMSQILTKQFHITSLIPDLKPINTVLLDVCPSYFRKSYEVASLGTTPAEIIPDLQNLIAKMNGLSACDHANDKLYIGLASGALAILVVLSGVALGYCIKRCLRNCEEKEINEFLTKVDDANHYAEPEVTNSPPPSAITLDNFDVHSDEASETNYVELPDAHKYTWGKSV